MAQGGSFVNHGSMWHTERKGIYWAPGGSRVPSNFTPQNRLCCWRSNEGNAKAPERANRGSFRTFPPLALFFSSGWVGQERGDRRGDLSRPEPPNYRPGAGLAFCDERCAACLFWEGAAHEHALLLARSTPFGRLLCFGTLCTSV